MLKEWQFNVLFFVGVGGAVLLMFGPTIGLKIDQNPASMTGVGSILGYILTQKRSWVRDDPSKSKHPTKKEGDDDSES